MTFSRIALTLGVAAIVLLHASEASAQVGARGHGMPPPAPSQNVAPYNPAPWTSNRGVSPPNYSRYFGGNYPYSPYYSYDYGSSSYYFDDSGYAGPFISPQTGAALPPIANDHPTVARLTLQVPLGAAVWLQGKLVDMTPIRTFISPELKPGESYTFDVKVVYMENGKQVEHKRSLTMKGGDWQSLQYIALPPRSDK